MIVIPPVAVSVADLLFSLAHPPPTFLPEYFRCRNLIVTSLLLARSFSWPRQAEDFDAGGEGVAYHDNSTYDEGGSNYRQVCVQSTIRRGLPPLPGARGGNSPSYGMLRGRRFRASRPSASGHAFASSAIQIIRCHHDCLNPSLPPFISTC